MKTCYIYTLSDPRNNQVRYVGKTNNPKQRRSAHGVLTREQKSRKKNWVKHLKSLGLKPVFEIIEEVNIDGWKEAEKFWITQFKAWGFRLLNHTSGGDGLTFGNSTSFKKGQVPWNKGTAKPKIKKGFNKKCLETAFKKGQSPWNKGRSGYNTKRKGIPLPEEVKQKISNTLKGRPSLKKRTVKQYSKKMILINTYHSIIEAVQVTGIKGIGNVLTGRAKTAGGYIWH